MATKKITLNELRSLVKQIIKEDLGLYPTDGAIANMTPEEIREMGEEDEFIYNQEIKLIEEFKNKYKEALQSLRDDRNDRNSYASLSEKIVMSFYDKFDYFVQKGANPLYFGSANSPFFESSSALINKYIEPSDERYKKLFNILNNLKNTIKYSKHTKALKDVMNNTKYNDARKERNVKHFARWRTL
jgi:phosphopantetheine adenylyltransferase